VYIYDQVYHVTLTESAICAIEIPSTYQFVTVKRMSSNFCHQF